MSIKQMTRRSFVQVSAIAASAVALTSSISSTFSGALKRQKANAAPTSARKMQLSTCHGCIQACPCKVYVENDVVVKIEGNPLAPTNQGSLCLKGLNQIHTCYSPRRVLYPLKRTGDIGAENAAWERISWDDAIELAATKIADAIKKYGTYAFFASVGGGGSYSFMQAMTMPQALGSPTVFEPGCAQCYLPRYSIAQFMYGGNDQSIADCAVLEPFKGLNKYLTAPGQPDEKVKNVTEVMVVWGAQPSVSQTSQSGRGMAELRARGCKTVVIDPNMSPDAVKATVWLRVRPAADGALCLSWWRYIIENKLYNEKHTKYWTNLPCIIHPDTHLPILAKDVFPGFSTSTPANTPVYVAYDLNTKSLQPLDFADTSAYVKGQTPKVDPEIFWSGSITVGGKTLQARSAGQVYKDAADPFTLKHTEEVTWVPADLNEKAIKIYTDPLKDGKVAGIANGVPSDMEQIASQLPIGLIGLDFIMGYVNKPGATLTQNQSSIPALASDGTPQAPKRPTTFFNGFGGMFGSIYGYGYEVGATAEENAARVASLPPGPPGMLVPGTKETMYVMNQIILDRLGMKNHKGLYHWAHSHIPTVREAIKTGEPYKPRVWYDMSGNKLAMLGNATSWYDVFKEVDFCICQYPMLTSFQVERADLVFPLQEWLEVAAIAGTVSQLNYLWGQTPVIHLGETEDNAIPPTKVVNRVSDILNEAIAGGTDVVLGAVGATTGVAALANPDTYKDGFTDTSKNASFLHATDTSQFKLSFPIGVGVLEGAQDQSLLNQNILDLYGAPSMEEFQANPEKYQTGITAPGVGQGAPRGAKQTNFVTTPAAAYWVYDQQNAIADDGLPIGFGTESRKLEAYAQLLVQTAKNGLPFTYPRMQEEIDPSVGFGEYEGTYSPICQHVEPVESPIKGDPGYDEKYPLVITSGRVYYFHHGTMRHAAYARELYPAPDVRMHPKTAEKYGLKHMDWVEVTSRRGAIRGRAYVTAGMAEGVLWMERFWNPEAFDSSQSKKDGGWRQMNINVITKNTAPYNEVYGSYTNRGFTVNIKKSERPANVWIEPKEFKPFMPNNDNQYVKGVGPANKLPQTKWNKWNDWEIGPMGPSAKPAFKGSRVEVGGAK